PKGELMRTQILVHAAAVGLSTALLADAPTPVHAALLTQRSMTASMALTVAVGAFEACSKQGHHVSVHVVGRNGEVIISIRGDGAAPHTMENSLRKAYTALTFRAPSGDFAKRVIANPTLGLQHLTGVIAGQGGVPIRFGDEVLGAVAVSGVVGGADV